jgi:hypothetical protein
MAMAIKEFGVTEGSTENMWYLIEVWWRGKIIERFHTPTMQQARSEFEAAGYRLVPEENRII